MPQVCPISKDTSTGCTEDEKGERLEEGAHLVVVAVLKEAHVCAQAVVCGRQLLLQLRGQLVQVQRPQREGVPVMNWTLSMTCNTYDAMATAHSRMQSSGGKRTLADRPFERKAMPWQTRSFLSAQSTSPLSRPADQKQCMCSTERLVNV